MGDGTGNGVRHLAGLPYGNKETEVAFVQDEGGLALSAEKHQVHLPMACCSATVVLGRTFGQGRAELNGGGVAAPAATPSHAWTWPKGDNGASYTPWS